MKVKDLSIQMIPVNNLNPAPYNPRKDLKPGDAEYEKLKQSLTEFGLVEPLVVNDNMTIVGGHQRYRVMTELGYTEIPCVIVSLDRKKEMALNVALNKISGFWDTIKLKELLIEINTDEFNMELSGFDGDELTLLLTDEEEFLTADKNAETIVESLTSKIKKIAAEHPRKLNDAICVIVQNGRGNACLFIADPNTADIVKELQRYADAGERSPLECLLRAKL